MAIVGLTHEKDGRIKLHRAVTCKIAIGLPPDANSNYPKKLDHFVFLQQEMSGKGVNWAVDKDKQEHFGADCKEFWIVLLDDDPEQCFRTEFAAYVKTRCWCRGDGEKAMRRESIKGEYKGDFKIWNQPCANGGCPDAESQGGKPAACKPSGDLYFMLQDYPELGTICRIHTSSWQSIRQIHSGLQDLCAVTGGRLMGVRCKLFVSPARNVFSQGGVEKTGTKYVLGLRLGAKDIPQLMSAMAETAQQFRGLQLQLAGRVLDVEEEDETRAPEIAAEFYPDKQVQESEQVQESDPAELERIKQEKLTTIARDLMVEHGCTEQEIVACLQKYQGNTEALIAKVRASRPVEVIPPKPTPEPKKFEATDDDLPDFLRDDPPPQTSSSLSAAEVGFKGNGNGNQRRQGGWRF